MDYTQETQSGFSRTIANEGKLGAYYTDLQHCRSLSGMFQFGANTLILEPSIGDASAVKAVTGKETGDGKYIFGIELNEETYEGIRDDPDLEAVLCAEACHGTKITNNQFTFCFSNPPYGDGELTKNGKHRRLETMFTERIFNLMKKGGILCFVIPETVLKTEEFIKPLIGRFEPVYLFRFREPEYSRFKQCVFIGRTRASVGWKPEWVESFRRQVDAMEELPLTWEGEPVSVPESVPESIRQFTTTEFHPAYHLRRLNENKPARQFEAMAVSQEEFGAKEVHPPIRLKRNLLYLLAASGEGQGMVGDEEEGTLHMQRGSAKRVSKSSFEKRGDEEVEVVTTSTQISMLIVENDGTITKLE